MRFQVPQFIEVEDKIFGPLTFKQFVYVAGGVGIFVLLFTFLPTFLAILIGLPVGVLAGALAFYKYNSKPFINFLESFLSYSLKNKLYVWRKEEKVATANEQKVIGAKDIQQVYVPKLSQSKLKDLTWSLDVKDANNPVTRSDVSTNDKI